MFCILGFTVLGIGKIFFDYNDMLIGYRATSDLMWKLLLDQIPSLWMDVIPAATLFGVILALGRLIRERELDVMRTSGAGLIRIMLPVFFGVFLICVGVFWWNDMVVPSANHHFQMQIRRLSSQQNLPLFKENIVFKAPQNRFIYLNKVDHKQGKISGILIIEVGGSGRWPRLITADSGKLLHGIWELRDGVINEIDDHGAVRSEIRFKKMEMKMAVDYSGIMSEQTLPSEMHASELLEKAILYKQSSINDPVYAVFYHSKFADPFISFILVLLAVPLAMLTGKNARWLGLVLCFLVIMGYYALQVVCRTMGVNGLIAPWMAAWTPHILFFGVGVFLLATIEQRR